MNKTDFCPSILWTTAEFALLKSQSGVYFCFRLIVLTASLYDVRCLKKATSIELHIWHPDCVTKLL